MLTAILLLLLGKGISCPTERSLSPTPPVFAVATADSTAPAKPLVLPVPGSANKLFTVVLPGQPPMVVPAEKLGDVLAAYTEGLAGDLDQDVGPAAINRAWGNVRDEISGEVESLLGEAESAIMQGISDQVESLVGQVLNASPVSEVVRLRRMMKDGLSKQQKIAYQDLKQDVAWRRAHTELSASFVDYYNALDIQSKFKWVSTQARQCERALASAWLTSGEAALYRGNVLEIADVGDLTADVNTVCNRGKSGVWMAESERIALLDEVVADLHDRAMALQTIHQQLRAAAVHRRKTAAENTQLRGLYRPGTRLNRTVNTLSTR